MAIGKKKRKADFANR